MREYMFENEFIIWLDGFLVNKKELNESDINLIKIKMSSVKTTRVFELKPVCHSHNEQSIKIPKILCDNANRIK